MQSFIRSIELYPEGEGKGRIIRRINFKFPVCYGDGEKGETVMLGESTVEKLDALHKSNEEKIHTLGRAAKNSLKLLKLLKNALH